MVYFLEDDNNLIDNLNNNNSNNNKRQKTEHNTTIIIEKIIILPLIIQKYIVELIYKHKKYSYKKYMQSKQQYRILNYAQVNWDWFKFCQIYHHYYQESTIEFKILQQQYKQKQQEQQQITEGITSIYKFKKDNLINKIDIGLSEINKESVLLLNSYQSLKKVTIVLGHSRNYLENHYKNLIYLNELNKNIIINFNINVEDINRWRKTFNFNKQQDKESFKFETNNFKFYYDDEYDDYQEEELDEGDEDDEDYLERRIHMNDRFMVLLEFLQLVDPKSILINVESRNYLDKHLPIYHSLSKFNQKFENIKIKGDFIPIFSFYRFLKAPNLKTLDIQFQFHFLLSIYNQNSYTSDVKRVYNKFNQNFDEIDNFKETLEIENQDDQEEEQEEQVDNGNDYTASVGIDFNDNGGDTVSSYDPNNIIIKNSEINENYQRYCFRFYDNEVNNLTVPKYSRSLWNDCLYQLENNKTINNLSISDTDCIGCNINYEEDDTLWSSNHQLFKDLSNSLANNKSIETLTLHIPELPSSQLVSFILDILDNNTTLKQLYISNTDDDDISNILKSTKNKNCKISLVNI